MVSVKGSVSGEVCEGSLTIGQLETLEGGGLSWGQRYSTCRDLSVVT